MDEETKNKWLKASTNGDLSTVKMLYEIYKDDIINVSDSQYNALIHATLNKFDIEVFKFLLSCPNINVNNIIYDYTPLGLSMYYKTTEKLEMLLKHPEIQVNQIIYNNYKIQTTLTYAYSNSYNKVEHIKKLLTCENLDVNIGCPVLTVTRHLNVFRLLIEDKRINLNVVNNKNEDLIDIFKSKNIFRDDSNITWYLTSYETQEIVINNNPENIKLFLKHKIIHKDIRQKYNHIISAFELNLI